MSGPSRNSTFDPDCITALFLPIRRTEARYSFFLKSPLDILLFPLWALTFVSATLLLLIFLPVISSWHLYPLPSVRLTPRPLIIFTPWQRDTGVAIETRSSVVKVTVSVVRVWACVCWDGSRVSLLVSMSEALWARWDIGVEISAGSEVNGNGTRGHVLYTQTQKQTGIYRNTTSCHERHARTKMTRPSIFRVFYSPVFTELTHSMYSVLFTPALSLSLLFQDIIHLSDNSEKWLLSVPVSRNTSKAADNKMHI